MHRIRGKHFVVASSLGGTSPPHIPQDLGVWVVLPSVVPVRAGDSSLGSRETACLDDRDLGERPNGNL